MSNKRSSPSPEFPSVEHLVGSLIEDLSVRPNPDGWWHLELESTRGAMLRALMRGHQPWIEVAMTQEAQLVLNVGRQGRGLPVIPKGWSAIGTGQFSIPPARRGDVPSWAMEFFSLAAGGQTRVVTADYRE